jgi:hypothetical protein
MSCKAIGLLPTIGDGTGEAPIPTRTTLTPTETRLPPTGTPTLTATPSFTQTPTHTPEPTGVPEPSFTVRYHPDDALYAGDQVSMEIIAPPELDLSGQSITVSISEPDLMELGPVEFGPFGIEQRMQATLWWSWDTSLLEAGSYTLTYSVDPVGYQWQESVVLNPPSALPPPEPDAEWTSTESACCTVHYITGTDAERDLDWLLEQIDEVAGRLPGKWRLSSMSGSP